LPAPINRGVRKKRRQGGKPELGDPASVRRSRETNRTHRVKIRNRFGGKGGEGSKTRKKTKKDLGGGNRTSWGQQKKDEWGN